MTVVVGQEKPSIEAILAHHGVKGMHWGVRKERDVSTESRKLRKQSSNAVMDYMWKAIENDPLIKTMTREEYDSLSTKGETFAAGLKLTRIAKMETKNIDAGALYVSKLKSDHEFYKAVIPATNMDGKFGAIVRSGRKTYKTPSYEVEMETVKKLSLPSDKERVDAFMSILSKPAIKLEGRDAPISGRQYLEENGYKYLLRKKTDQEAAFEAYYSVLRGQGDQSSPLNKAYFDELKKRGFNAVIDANDAGSYTVKPIVVLDANKSVKVTRIRKLSTDEVNQAQRALATRTSPGEQTAIVNKERRVAEKAQRKAEKKANK